MASKTDYDKRMAKRRMTVRGHRSKEATAFDEAVGKAGKAAMASIEGEAGKEAARKIMAAMEYPETWDPSGTRRVRFPAKRMFGIEDTSYKKGGAVIKEKETGEVYKSRKAMLVHERGESAAEERKQHKLKAGAKMPADWKTAHGMKKGGKVGYMKGGAVSGGRGKNMVASTGPKAPAVVKPGAVKLATGGAAKMKPHSTSKKTSGRV